MSRIWTFICVALLAAGIGAAAWIGRDVAARAMRMQPARTDTLAFAAAKAGERLKVIVRIDSRDASGVIVADQLVPLTDTEYRATATLVHARLVPDALIVMGTADDVRPGALAQLDGVMNGSGALETRKAVILTAYIHVARRS